MKATEMQYKLAQSIASDHGMRINKMEYGEYHVTASRDRIPDYERREAIAYYTDDLDDAVNTMRAMQMELQSKHPVEVSY